MKIASAEVFAATIGTLLLAGLVAYAPAAHATDDDLKCRQTINKEFVKYVKMLTKIVQKCNDAQVKEGMGGNAPGGGDLDEVPFWPFACDIKGKSMPGLVRMHEKIVKKCDDEDIQPYLISWPATCPNFEGEDTCPISITNGDQIADCLECIGKAAIKQAMDLYYLELQNSSDKDIIKCQRAIGKETSKFLMLKHKELANCRKQVDKGNATLPCPAGYPKSAEKIAKGEFKKVAKICKACGGGGSVDGLQCMSAGFPPALIGFAGFCPAVTVPDGGPACGGPISSLQDIVTCVDCVTEFKVDCLDPLSRPDQKPYPAECGPPVP